MQTLLNEGKKLNKPVYVFAIDSSGDAPKVAHAAFVPPELISPTFDARIWANEVSEVLGGRAGGKPDTAQGVGIELTKLEEASKLASKRFA